MSEDTPSVEPEGKPHARSELTAQEKRANAERENQYLDMGKMTAKAMERALALIQLQIPGVGNLIVNASPADLMQVVAMQQQRIAQLEVSLGAVVDLLMFTKLVAIAGEDEIDNPVEELREKVPKVPRYFMGPAPITLERYWLLCAASAEKQAALLRRGILSAGSGGDKPLLKM